MAADDIRIKVRADVKKANADLKATQNSIGGIKEKGAGIFSKFNIGVAAAGAGLAVLVKGIKSVVKAYSIQEEAEKTLAAAMRQAGTFTEEAYQHNLKYAASLQKVTTFGDEAILGVQKMLTNFKIEGKALDGLTKATLDLAAAKGMDLKSAADLVAKSVGSSTNALTRYGIEVTGAAGSTERAEQAIQNITNLFGGAAAAKAGTFAGKMTQLQNALGDIMEKIGGKLAPTFGAFASGLTRLLTPQSKVKETTDKLSAATDTLRKARKNLNDETGKSSKNEITYQKALAKSAQDTIDALLLSGNELYIKLSKGKKGLFGGQMDSELKILRDKKQSIQAEYDRISKITEGWVADERAMQEQALKDRSGGYNPPPEMQSLEKALEEQRKQKEKLIKVNEEEKSAVAEIHDMIKQLAKAYNEGAVSEKILGQVDEDFRNQIIKTAEKYKELEDRIKAKQKAEIESIEEAESLQTKYKNGLERIRREAELFGEEYDDVGNKLILVDGLLKELAASGEDMNTDFIKGLRKTRAELAQLANEEIKPDSDPGDEIKAREQLELDQKRKTLEQMKGFYQSFYSAISTIASQALQEDLNRLNEMRQSELDALDEETAQRNEEDLQRQIEQALKVGDEKKVAELRAKQQEIEIEKQKQADIDAINEKYDKKERDRKTKNARASKAANVAMAIVEAIAAGIAAFRSTAAIPIIGPPAAPAAAISATGWGLAKAGIMAATPIPAFAQGGTMITDGPQMFLAGDNASGREKIDITPLDDAVTPSGNTYNFYGIEDLAEARNELIRKEGASAWR